MIEVQKIDKVLLRIRALLELGSSSNWVRMIDNLREEILRDPIRGVSNILAIYGGMGSFNDIVLYREGIVLISENVELDKLRLDLYRLCQ